MGIETDIYGYRRNAKPSGVFSSEDSILTITGGGSSIQTFLVQNVSVQYHQGVDEIFELGSNRIYYSKTRPQGMGSLGRIAGGDVGNRALPPSAFDICDGGATMILIMQSGACKGGANRAEKVDIATKRKLTMGGVIVTNTGYSMSVGDTRLVEAYAWRFSQLSDT